jgi:outer membrane protein assembly factor BamB
VIIKTPLRSDPSEEPYTITQAPRVIKGRVVIGNSGSEYGVRGYISAYDAETGELAWRFYTVPGDPARAMGGGHGIGGGHGLVDGAEAFRD